MNCALATSFHRREFLKSIGLFAGAALTGMGFPQEAMAQSVFESDRFTQRINEVRLYMTHYAYFEEPDDDIPPALYFDALTGQPTDELALRPTVGQRSWSRPDPNLAQLIATREDFFDTPATKPEAGCSGRFSIHLAPYSELSPKGLPGPFVRCSLQRCDPDEQQTRIHKRAGERKGFSSPSSRTDCIPDW